MPYSYPDNVPDYIKNLPDGAQKLCVAAFNATIEKGGSEEQARIACWGAVKNEYEQRDGEWVRKEGTMIDLTDITTAAKAYALHNKLHAEYVDARWGVRRKAQMQEDHEAVVRRILELGGRHIPHGESLDETLPAELREAFTMSYISEAIELAEAVDAPPRSTIQILRTGTFYHPIYGRFNITKDTLASMVHNFHEVYPQPPTELVVDWEHMSTEPAKKAPAAGWVKDVIQRDGTLWTDVEWTEEAVTEIRAKSYRFISPHFNLNYVDKGSGKPVGPTLLSVALTNRPFVDGMQPVALSERFDNTVFIEQLPISAADNEVLLGTAYDETITLAEWTTAYINDLPDSAFAFIKSGGEKDEDGKTVPRSLRYLPYKDKDGNVDLPHLRNALSRLPQTNLTPEEKTKARAVLIAAAKEAGIGSYSELPDVSEAEFNEINKEGTLPMEKLLVVLGAADEDAALKVVAAMKDAAETAETKLTGVEADLAAEKKRADDAELKLTAQEVEKLVNDALTAGKLTPKMVEWAKDYALRDRAGFDSFLEHAEKVGPDLTVKGKDGEGDLNDVQLSDTERQIAEKCGISVEDVMKQKKEDTNKA